MVEFKLAEIRAKQDIPLRTLEKLSGVSKTHIHNIESGNTMPTIDILCKLASALRVPVTELFRYRS